MGPKPLDACVSCPMSPAAMPVVSSQDRVLRGVGPVLSVAFLLTLAGCPSPWSTDTHTVGAATHEIFYGTDVPEGKYPWLTKLPNCSGASISPHFVLSAAHCYGYGKRNDQGTLEGIAITSGPVRIGHPDYNNPAAKQHAVRTVSLHPEYIKLTRDEVWGLEPFDIVLLELEQPVYLTDYLRLPTREPLEGEALIAAGWGETEDGYVSRARETTLEVRQRSGCFGGDAKRFCSRGGPANRQSNIGPGDSGGPVFVDDGDGYMVLGTNSTSNGDSSNTYATHATTFVFMHWVLEIAAADFTCPGGDPGNGCTANVDECLGGLHDCHGDATCTDLADGFECHCHAGYQGDGVSCVDRDECADGTDNCSGEATCTNTPGGFTCACPAGFSGDGTTCNDIDECANGTDNCSGEAICTNSPGGFTCACPAGFSGDGTTCNEIDECATGTDTCSGEATCTNTVGGFNCTCNAGFVGDGVTCSLQGALIASPNSGTISGRACSGVSSRSAPQLLWGLVVARLLGRRKRLETGAKAGGSTSP